MPGPTYKVHGLPLQRRPASKLLRSILRVLGQNRHPMPRMEIISALAKQYRRTDPEFQRQALKQLHDAVDYGILKQQSDFYSVRSRRLNAVLSTLTTYK